MNSDDLPTLEELAALLPQYRFESLLAEGGMGAVYRAEQRSLGRHVAIKILPRSLTAEATYREQFKSEARLMGSLTYPHIVDIHDFGEAGDVLYIVMELLEGVTLYQRMRAEPLKQAEVVKILGQVCDALTAAHHKGVVHRDVKPENIFVEPGLRVKLGDFGIARQRRTDLESGESPQAAISGVRLGTPEYAAPELFDFQKHIDHRADIFSLGVVLYELLTGARPTGAFIAPSKRKAGVDRRFDDVVIRAMQFEPGDRYASTEEMKKDLLRVLSVSSQPARAPAAGKTPTGQKGARPAPAVAPQATPPPAKAEAPAPKPASKKNPALLWGGIGGAAAAIGILIMVLKGSGGKARNGAAAASQEQLEKILADDEQPEPEPSSPSTTTVRPAPPPPRELGPPAAKLTAEGHTYQFIPSRLAWSDAKMAAEKAGGHLACVTTQKEYDALRDYLLLLLQQHNDACWLGASDAEAEGTWKWLTGEPFEFVKWAPDAPNNGNDGRGAQNFLGWQRQSKYGTRQIEWNDLAERLNPTTTGGYLIEWEQAEPATPAPAIAETPKPMPVTPASPTDQTSPTTGWQPVNWTEEVLAKLVGRVALTDGWYVLTGPQTLDLPPAVSFTDGALRARLRVESGARSFHIKPRYSRGEALLCSLDLPGAIKVVRRDAGAPVPLADWALATPLQPGDEVRLELRLTGTRLTMIFNGLTVGSLDTADRSPEQGVRIFSHGFSFREMEWHPLDGVTDAEKALAAPSAYPGNAELAAAAAAFAQKKDAAYAAKLQAAIKSLRDSYANRLRALAGQKPAEAVLYNTEAALITGGGDPPPADAPGTPPALAPLRKTWHDAKLALEKPLAAVALTVWSEHLAQLQAMESALRQAKKLADAADLAPHCQAAASAVAHFTALLPPGRK